MNTTQRKELVNKAITNEWQTLQQLKSKTGLSVGSISMIIFNKMRDTIETRSEFIGPQEWRSRQYFKKK